MLSLVGNFIALTRAVEPIASGILERCNRNSSTIVRDTAVLLAVEGPTPMADRLSSLCGPQEQGVLVNMLL